MQAGSNILAAGRQAVEKFREHLATDEEQDVTHMQGNLFMDSHCFLVRKERLDVAAQNHLDLRRLGLRVKFKGKCLMSTVWCDRPDACRACPHKFGCGCPTKYKQFAWCPHIHVAERMGLHRYKEMRLCIHDYESSSAEMRHLRAWVQGEDFMERTNEPPVEPGLSDYAEFREKSPGIPGSERRVIKVEKPWPEYDCVCQPDRKCEVCGACYCRYACTCDDWARDKRTCQHSHWVAMTHFKELETNPFKNPPSESIPLFHYPEYPLATQLWVKYGFL